DDVLTGGAGSDTMQGGAGDDTYHTGTGVDTIVDGRGANVLDLGTGASVSQLRVEALYGGNSTYSISWGGPDAVLLGTSEGSGFAPLSFAEMENLYSIRIGASGQTVNFRHLMGRYQEVAVVRDALTDTGTYGVIAFGSAVDDSIAFAGGQGQMYGGHGNDEFIAVANILGMRGGNSYLYELGDGTDTITDSGAMGAQTAENVVRFGAGIAAADLHVMFLAGDNETVVVQIGDDPSQRLQLRHSAGAFRRTMGEQSVIDRFEFADGSSVTWAQLIAPGFDFSGTGNADVIVGSGAVDRMDGFEGNDILNGLRGADVLDGGTGDDLYIINNGASVVTEGADGGMDTVRFVGSATSLSYVLAANVENLELSWEFDSADSLALNGTGNALDNLITGNVASNVVDGAAGNDRLEGELGDDVLVGGSGDDLLDGGAGLDTYRIGANHGSDVIESQVDVYGRQRQDVVVFEAHASTDVRTVRNGNDLLVEPVAGGTPLLVIRDFFTVNSEVAELRFANAVTLTWQQILAANAPVFTNAADDAVGTDLPDTYRLLDGNDTATGGLGDDSLYGDGGNDSLAGDEDNDLLDGGAGNDALDGGQGNDTLVGGTGSDTLMGGFGADVYRFDRGFGTDSIQGVEDWSGTQQIGDTVRFGAGIVLSDLVPVLGSNGLRLHVLRAGGITGDSIDLVEHWNMNGAPSFDGVVRFEFADGSSATLDQVLGSTIRVTQGADSYRPSPAGGTISLLGGADTFSGQGGADFVDGGDGDDSIDGAGGDDRLNGGQGFDTLNGGDGNDELDGGRGLDFLNGGLGGDRYLVSRNSGRDWVSDDGGAN
ncbi:MAG TPA: calcium-binding protein, partial [Ilumatobacteraceae bacterium]|nr:calcium-binding protein [Ilumatobacteraceae bacterium]